VLDDDAASGEGDKAHRTAIGLRGHIPLHARLHVGAKTRSERACELQRVRRVCASLRDAAVVPTALQRGGRVVTRARVLVREVIVEARLPSRGKQVAIDVIVQPSNSTVQTFTRNLRQSRGNACALGRKVCSVAECQRISFQRCV